MSLIAFEQNKRLRKNKINFIIEIDKVKKCHPKIAIIRW